MTHRGTRNPKNMFRRVTRAYIFAYSLDDKLLAEVACKCELAEVKQFVDEFKGKDREELSWEEYRFQLWLNSNPLPEYWYDLVEGGLILEDGKGKGAFQHERVF